MAYAKRLRHHEGQGNLDLQVREEQAPTEVITESVVNPVSSNVTHLVTNYESNIRLGDSEVQFNVPRNRVKRDSNGKITELELKISGNEKTLVVFKVYLRKYNIKHQKETVSDTEYDYVGDIDITSITKVN